MRQRGPSSEASRVAGYSASLPRGRLRLFRGPALSRAFHPPRRDRRELRCAGVDPDTEPQQPEHATRAPHGPPCLHRRRVSLTVALLSIREITYGGTDGVGREITPAGARAHALAEAGRAARVLPSSAFAIGHAS